MTKHIHGGDVYKHKDCLDFSANLNPLGTPESVKQAIIHSLGDMCAVSPGGMRRSQGKDRRIRRGKSGRGNMR